MKSTVKTYYMGNQSLARQRYYSIRVRQNYQGRDFFPDRRGWKDSRVRDYFRRYYGGESRGPRDFSRDMRSVSRERSRWWIEKEIRSDPANEAKREYTECIGCLCKECVQMRKMAQNEINAMFPPILFIYQNFVIPP